MLRNHFGGAAPSSDVGRFLPSSSDVNNSSTITLMQKEWRINGTLEV
jgi:hypothetical protein